MSKTDEEIHREAVRQTNEKMIALYRQHNMDDRILIGDIERKIDWRKNEIARMQEELDGA